MTATSEIGYWVTPYETLDADYPMSAATARWYLNNCRHLIDMSTQTRINWVALSEYHSPATELEGITWDAEGSADWSHVITMVFPVTCVGANAAFSAYRKPSNLVVSVAGYSEGSDTLYIRAVIQPANKSKSHDLTDSDCLAYFEDNTQSNTPVWIIDGVTTALYPSNIESKPTTKNFSLAEYDGNNHDVTMSLLRLSIYAHEDSSAGQRHVTGIYVREVQAT